jgi:hypothetical protein
MRPSFDSEPHLKLSMHIKSIGFLPFSTSMMRKVMETPQVLEIVLNSPVFGTQSQVSSVLEGILLKPN